MRLPDEMTYGESLGPAMKITDPAEAQEYFCALVDRNMRITGNNSAQAEEVVRSNLGYYSGYYSRETMARVEKLFSCVHPIFGTVEELKKLSAKQIFEKGVSLGSDGT